MRISLRHSARRSRTGAALAALLLSAACQLVTPPSSLKPQARPDALVTPAAMPAPAGPSEESESLRRYYTAFQADLLTQGLLRTDGGGVDTPYTSVDLAQNFEQIALYDEYVRGAGLRSGGGTSPSFLRRWTGPVRVTAEFGPSVAQGLKEKDLVTVRDYTARLGRVTGHPISYAGDDSANFYVLVMGEDDRELALTRIKQIVPNISASSLNIFNRLPRTIHCLVIAFSSPGNDAAYSKAVAFVRAEHPDLIRKSCYHEEMAQGLGLANDSPHARPSIFNDDDEFALLTSHDEKLLKMLYDPRLRTGMKVAEARPIIADIAQELTGGPS